MSLINDALRRAKAAQQQETPPPAPPLQFRPVEATQHVQHGRGLLWPAVWALVAPRRGLLCLAVDSSRESTSPRDARARTPAAVDSIATPPPASALVTAANPAAGLAAQANSAPRPASQPSPVIGSAAPVAPEATSAPASPTVANPQENGATNTAATTVAPPKPAPLRLQAIVFNPKQPSAIVSGKTLFIGDKLGDLRVVAIDRGSLTLVGAGQTNVLSLSK